MAQPLSRFSATPPSHPHAAVAFRLAAAFLVGILALPSLWQAFHLLTVPHFECPYDGALVHSDELPDNAGTARFAQTHGSGPAVVPHHDHGHCGEPSWGPRAAVVFSFGPALIATVAWLSRTESLRLYLGSLRDVLSYAPKLPPPAQI
jgi:hypothetical protein